MEMTRGVMGGGPIVGGSREAEYERMAQAIGRLDPPKWSVADDAAKLSGGVTTVWVFAFVILAYDVWSVIFGVLILVSPLLFWEPWSKQESEMERERKLLSAVTRDMEFLKFYALYFGAPLHSFDLSGGGEGVAQQVGRPNPPKWTGVQVGAWCLLPLGLLTLSSPWWIDALSGGNIGHEMGLVAVQAVAVVCFGVWMGLYRRMAHRAGSEQERRWRLLNAVAVAPGFLSFYDEWCRR